MEIALFSQLLADSIADSQEQSTRCIISFLHKEHYQLCVNRIRNGNLSGNAQSALQLLPDAGAVSCRLADSKWLEPFRPYISVEPDRRLHVGSNLFLPSAGKPSLSFDRSKKIPWGVSAVRAPSIWRKSKGERIRIGVVDTGADYNHPDIRSVLMNGVNLVNPHATAADDNGHGTHIAGTIAAIGGKEGVRGIAPHAVLYPVKAFDRDGSAFVSDIILAIHWCIANRMDVINMSFGMSEFSQALYQAVKAAHRRNVVIVASSGNGGQPNDIDYPARMAQTIAVGAVNKSGKIAVFSNRGKAVDIYAPGEKIYSTWPGHRYHELNGTSMAAAHVSGVVALLIAAKPKLKLAKLKTALTASSVPFTAPKRTGSAGRLDAAKAWFSLNRNTVKKKHAMRPSSRSSKKSGR